VAERWHNPGDVIDANEHVLRVVDLRRLQVTAAVPVADATRVVLGHSARVTVPGGEGREIAGKVVGAAATVDPATGTAAIRVAVSGALPVGTPVEIAILAEQRANTLIVPADAIVREENKTAVFVLGSDNKAHRRGVVVGLVSAEEAQIVSGLREGEKVVVKGQDELPDGATVTIEKAEESEPAAAEERAGEAPTSGGTAERPVSGGAGGAPPAGTAEAAGPASKGRDTTQPSPPATGPTKAPAGSPPPTAATRPPAHPMNPARVSSRHARAVLLVTALLAGAGFISLRSLPSDIYPPLNFPRVVIIGHTGTLPARSMALSVTRPIEQVVMEVPGIRRVRSTTFRGSTEISAQFDPSFDILQALQQVQNRVAELRGELPAETELTVERLTTSPFPSSATTSPAACRRPISAMPPSTGAGPASPACPASEGWRSCPATPRDRGRHSATAPAGQRSHRARCGGGAQSGPTRSFRWPGTRRAASNIWSWPSGLWASVPGDRADPGDGQGGAVLRVADLGDVFPAHPTASPSSRATAGPPPS
jgi:hypothetical protein